MSVRSSVISSFEEQWKLLSIFAPDDVHTSVVECLMSSKLLRIVRHSVRKIVELV